MSLYPLLQEVWKEVALCVVYMGTSVLTYAAMVTYTFLSPIVSSYGNFPFSSLDSPRNVTESAILVSSGIDD